MVEVSQKTHCLHAKISIDQVLTHHRFRQVTLGVPNPALSWLGGVLTSKRLPPIRMSNIIQTARTVPTVPAATALPVPNTRSYRWRRSLRDRSPHNPASFPHRTALATP